MSLREIGEDAHGRPLFERLPFDAREYRVPPEFVDEVRRSYASFGARELLEQHEGPFSGFVRVREIERQGRQFIVLRRAARDEWAIEVELTENRLGEIRALSPEEAWTLARERDAAHDPPITLATKR